MYAETELSIVLTALEVEDAEILQRWRAIPQIRDGALLYPFPTSLVAERKWILAQQAQGTPANISLAVRDTKHSLLGYVQLRSIDWSAGTGEFGIVIGAARGRGIGNAALVATMTYASEQLGLRRLWLKVIEYNAPAIALYERNGFELEGRLRRHAYRCGAYHDVLIFAKEFFRDSSGSQLKAP